MADVIDPMQNIDAMDGVEFHDDVDMMDWQATPPAAEVNTFGVPGKSFINNSACQSNHRLTFSSYQPSSVDAVLVTSLSFQTFRVAGRTITMNKTTTMKMKSISVALPPHVSSSVPKEPWATPRNDVWKLRRPLITSRYRHIRPFKMFDSVNERELVDLSLRVMPTGCHFESRLPQFHMNLPMTPERIYPPFPSRSRHFPLLY